MEIVEGHGRLRFSDVRCHRSHPRFVFFSVLRPAIESSRPLNNNIWPGLPIPRFEPGPRATGNATRCRDNCRPEDRSANNEFIAPKSQIQCAGFSAGSPRRRWEPEAATYQSRADAAGSGQSPVPPVPLQRPRPAGQKASG